MTRPPVDRNNFDSPLAKALAASHAVDLRRLRSGVEALQAALPAGGVVFNKKLRSPGHAPVDVVFTWPGVLMRLDLIGGEIIREAAAAEMHTEMRDDARFMAKSARGKPLRMATFQPPQGKRLRASFWADGVVRVHAVQGGELLAESEPGQPDMLRAGFRSLSVADLAPRLD